MKQIGGLCPCLLILMLTTTSVQSREIVKFSIYDEFGDIMFDSPGKLVLNGKKGSLQLDDEDQSDVDFDKYRYRTDTYESAYEQGQKALTTYRKNHYQKKVWNFRPLDKDKKTIIKIEDSPIPAVQQPMFYGSPMMMPGTASPGMLPGMNYPAMNYPGMVNPGMYSPGLMAPGMMSPGFMSPGMFYPVVPFGR